MTRNQQKAMFAKLRVNKTVSPRFITATINSGRNEVTVKLNKKTGVTEIFNKVETKTPIVTEFKKITPDLQKLAEEKRIWMKYKKDMQKALRIAIKNNDKGQERRVRQRLNERFGL